MSPAVIRNEYWYLCRPSVLWRLLKRVSLAHVLLMFSLWKRDVLPKEGGKKHFTFQLPPAPSPFPSSPGLVSGEKEKGCISLAGQHPPPLSHSPAIILASTFMHETEKKIESIQWPFRQWRKGILRALLDMKIYNKNQFLASLCSLNDKASSHSAIVCRKVILQHRPRQERRILSDLRLQILIWYRPTEIIGGT